MGKKSSIVPSILPLAYPAYPTNKTQSPDSKNFLLKFDKQISSYCYITLGQAVPRSFLKFLEHSGNGLFWIPAAIIFSLLPFIPPIVRIFSINLFIGFVIDLALIGILKVLFRRSRPQYNDMADYMLVSRVDLYSFPSGHASRSILIACLCAVFWRWTFVLGVVAAAVWGAATSASRILLGRHFFGDVMVGSMLGVGNAMILTQGSMSPENLLFSEAVVGRMIESIQGQIGQSIT